VFGCADKTVRMVELATGKELFKAGHHEDWVLDAVFGIDGKRIVSVGRDRAAKLADAADGACLENVNFLRDLLFTVARHPRRDYVLIGGADRVPFLYTMDRPRALKIADDSTLIRKFDEQDGVILSLAFNPDGSRIAVGGMSPTVAVYETETGKQAAKCAIGSEGIYALRFSPDGKTLATGGFDGHIRLFNTISSSSTTSSFFPLRADSSVAASLSRSLAPITEDSTGLCAIRTSIANTEPKPGAEYRSILCPSSLTRRSTMARPSPSPLLESSCG
jgi:WD40 repeat protein